MIMKLPPTAELIDNLNPSGKIENLLFHILIDQHNTTHKKSITERFTLSTTRAVFTFMSDLLITFRDSNSMQKYSKSMNVKQKIFFVTFSIHCTDSYLEQRMPYRTVMKKMCLW
jgi:hypothetical protein